MRNPELLKKSLKTFLKKALDDWMDERNRVRICEVIYGGISDSFSREILGEIS